MTASLPKTYRAAAFTSKGGDLEIIQREFEAEIPSGQVLVKVLACGVCHSDDISKFDAFGAATYPMVPGHEICGEIVQVPDSEKHWKVGQIIGSGWHGGHDGTCDSCAQGRFITCENEAINGINRPGGYAEYAYLRSEAIFEVPKGMDPTQVGPLCCAGVTTYNSIRNMPVQAGSLVAIQGIGGLGHLAVAFASKMGFEVAALSTNEGKRDLATQLGAKHYIVGDAESQAEQLQKLGGAKLVVVTAPSSKAVPGLVHGMQADGTLLILGVQEAPIPFDTVALISKRLTIRGWPSGSAADSSETCKFAFQSGVKVLTEEYSLDDASKAFADMMAGKPRFRAVIKM